MKNLESKLFCKSCNYCNEDMICENKKSDFYGMKISKIKFAECHSKFEGMDISDLAVNKGICPFPNSCNKRDFCTKVYCNYNECDNGHCFRRS